MDIALTIVRAIVHLVILCVRCFCSRSREQKKSNRIPAKKTQHARWAVVGGAGWFVKGAGGAECNLMVLISAVYVACRATSRVSRKSDESMIAQAGRAGQ